MKIKCSCCGKVARVHGRIWEKRLKPDIWTGRTSTLDKDGHHLGWHCDNCAAGIETGGR